MISINEKYEAVRYLKNVSIQHQKYELAAWLRERERNFLDEIGLEDYSHSFRLNYNQYHYALEVISTYENGYNYNEQEIIEKIRKDCIDMIRDQKLDELFGK